jgi:hypothetical protein
MKFMIGDKEYDAEQGVAKVSLSTLYELKVKHGIGMKTLVSMTRHFADFKDPLDLLEDKNAFRAFMIIIWLARRYAGEHCSLEEASQFPLDSLRIVNDEPEPESDPKAPTASSPDESAPATTTT